MKKSIFFILFLITESVFAQKLDTLFISALKYYHEEQKLQENTVSELKKKANTDEIIIESGMTNFLKQTQSILPNNSQTVLRYESENRKYWTRTLEKQEKKKKKRKKKKDS